jgi:hypothetical protein
MNAPCQLEGTADGGALLTISCGEGGPVIECSRYATWDEAFDALDAAMHFYAPKVAV